jgi:hypothetical protein
MGGKNRKKLAGIKRPLTEDQKKRKNELKRKRYYENLEHSRELGRKQSLKYRLSNPRWAILSNIKCRAKEANLECSVITEDIEIPEYCPVLGVKLSKYGEDDYQRKYAPSVDRVDNMKGYTKDNIRIISERANRLKSDASIDELKAIVKYMEEHLND